MSEKGLFLYSLQDGLNFTAFGEKFYSNEV